METDTRFLVAAGLGGADRDDLPVSAARYFVSDLKSMQSSSTFPSELLDTMKSFC